MTREEIAESIVDFAERIDVEKQVELWNKYCDRYDNGMIFTNDVEGADNYMSQSDSLTFDMMCACSNGNWRQSDDYFIDNGSAYSDLYSFKKEDINDILEWAELADYAVSYNEDFGFSEIRELLDEEE